MPFAAAIEMKWNERATTWRPRRLKLELKTGATTWRPRPRPQSRPRHSTPNSREEALENATDNRRKFIAKIYVLIVVAAAAAVDVAAVWQLQLPLLRLMLLPLCGLCGNDSRRIFQGQPPKRGATQNICILFILLLQISHSPARSRSLFA